MIGQTISHYKILEKLGEGGMGVIYKAHDTKLDRTVALKFLPPHLSASDQDKARFVQEAKAAAALNHPNVCSVIDISEHDGQIFIVMEFVEGQTLREKVKNIPLKQGIEIAIQLSEGLAAAHEKGIVHRDIKPENIMVRKDGRIQIMDFGLAKLRQAAGVSRLTKEGSTLGTLGYMSPEQVQGPDVDHRSDIFSLGVVLYELFTGQLPFRGVHETALAYEIVNVDPPPMSSINQQIDPSLDAIVLECLEKDPSERTQSVRQVAVDLKRYKRESSRQRASRITAARAAQKFASSEDVAMQVPFWRRDLWPVTSAVLVIALVLTIWAPWRTKNRAQSVARFSITLPKDQVLGLNIFSAIAVSPDGSRIVYRADGMFHQKKIDGFDSEVIPGTEDASSPFFSPDGRWLAFFAAGKLKKIPLSGGVPAVLADASNNRGGTWTSDGTIVFTPGGRGGLVQIRDDGGDARQLTSEDSVRNERTHRWPQALPDGKTIIFTVGSMDSPDYYEDAIIAALDTKTGERKVLLKGASTARYIAAGFLLYSNSGTLFAVPFDIDRLEVRGAAFPVVENVSGDPTTGATNYCSSENGTLAYIPGRTDIFNRTLALIDRESKVTELPVPTQVYLDPRMSPDGRQLAVVVGSRRDFDVWIYNIERNTMSRLTFGGPNRSPVWSPDGKRIAYSYNESRNWKIIIRQADGSGTPEEIKVDLGGHDRGYVNFWSRDGSMLGVITAHSGMGWDIVVFPLTGDRKPWTYLSTKFDEWMASLSPNGKWLAYISNETGVTHVYVRPFPSGSGKWQISTEPAFEPHWSNDGKTLYYFTAQGIMTVPIEGTQSLIAAQPTVWLKDYRGLSIESGITYDIAPDGKHIVVTRGKEGEQASQQINIVMNWFDEVSKTVASAR